MVYSQMPELRDCEQGLYLQIRFDLSKDMSTQKISGKMHIKCQSYCGWQFALQNTPR